jgi:hypothetical protein
VAVRAHSNDGGRLVVRGQGDKERLAYCGARVMTGGTLRRYQGGCLRGFIARLGKDTVASVNELGVGVRGGRPRGIRGTTRHHSEGLRRGWSWRRSRGAACWPIHR